MSVVAVTGATGNVGGALVEVLLKDSGVSKVVCLVRGESRARKLLPHSDKLEFAECDLAAVGNGSASFAGLVDVLGSCHVVYHSAGLPEQWQADETIFHRVNVEGTVSLLEALAESKRKDPSAPVLQRFLLVSTMDVFHCEPNGTLVETNEATERDFGRPGKATAYEQSKVRQLAEARRLADEHGIPLTAVCPGSVYGPSAVKTGTNAFISDFLKGKVPALSPGGFPVCYNADCAEAIVRAARSEKAVGQLYLLAGEYHTNASIAKTAIACAAADGPPDTRDPTVQEILNSQLPPVLPLWVLAILARLTASPARILGVEPIVAPSIVSFLSWCPRVDARKAERDLGYKDRSFMEGMSQTVKALRQRGWVPPPKPLKRKGSHKLIVLAVAAAALAVFVVRRLLAARE